MVRVSRRSFVTFVVVSAFGSPSVSNALFLPSNAIGPCKLLSPWRCPLLSGILANTKLFIFIYISFSRLLFQHLYGSLHPILLQLACILLYHIVRKRRRKRMVLKPRAAKRKKARPERVVLDVRCKSMNWPSMSLNDTIGEKPDRWVPRFSREVLLAKVRTLKPSISRNWISAHLWFWTLIIRWVHLWTLKLSLRNVFWKNLYEMLFYFEQDVTRS